MADKDITLDEQIEFLEWGIVYHGEAGRKIKEIGYTENLHAEYEEMFKAMLEQLCRLRGLEK